MSEETPRVVANLTVLIQDGSLAVGATTDLTEDIKVDSESTFTAGPTSDRVQIIDIDPDTSQVTTPVPFIPPQPGRVEGHYHAARVEPDHDGFASWVRVSTYGLVMRAIELFEYDDVLARPIEWNFDAAQLTVRPRADRTANAAYRRKTASLEFGAFASSRDPSTTVYTALSRDIVAHETAHAVLDSLRPDLANGNPQSIALHEALADLTALHMALRSRRLRDAVMQANDFELSDSTPFNAIGEEMGVGRGEDGSLRNLAHDKTMADVDATNPHELSEVLSGAMWSVFKRAFDADVARTETEEPTSTKEQRVGKALGIGLKRFRRITLRALDYLPHGEAGFIDYGRAIIAADRAAHPRRNRERQWLRTEFIRRGIVTNADELESPVTAGPVEDTASFYNDDDIAVAYFDAHRESLGIPADAEIEVPERQRVKRTFFPRGTPEEQAEIIAACRWSETTTGLAIPGLPPVLELTIGTTVVIDAETGHVRSTLTSTAARAQAQAKLNATMQLAQSVPVSVGYELEVINGAVRLTNAAAALHLA